MGHPTLRKVARPLECDELGSEEIQQLVSDMVDTLRQSGGIGLAAPQVNESVRLAIIDIPGGPSRYGDMPAMPLTVFVNPIIEVLGEETAGYWEGCAYSARFGPTKGFLHLLSTCLTTQDHKVNKCLL